MTERLRWDDAEAAPFLPTLKRARSGCAPLDPDADGFHLPPGEPSAQRRLAAIIVLARVVRRESREEDVEVSAERASDMLPDMPSAPEDFTAQSYLVRIRADAAAKQPCTGCDPRQRGFTVCHCCGGTGFLSSEAPCTACHQGFIPCAICDGAGQAIGVRVRYVNDVLLGFRDTFIPEVFRYVPALFSFPRLLRALLAEVDPPLCLAVPLSGQIYSSAYRGVVRQEAEPIFQGHRFEDALETARRSLSSLVKPKTEIVLHDVRSYAWPFLWLEFSKGRDKRDAVLVARPDGSLAGYAGDAAGARP